MRAGADVARRGQRKAAGAWRAAVLRWPASYRRTLRRNVSGGARDGKQGHPSGARILKPCVLAVKIAR